MAPPTLLANVKFKIDKNFMTSELDKINQEAINGAMKTTEKGILNSLNEQIRNLDKVIGESENLKLIKQASMQKSALINERSMAEKGSTGVSSGGFMGKMLGTITKPLGMIGGTLGSILGGISIGVAILSAAKPLVRMVESVTKMIGEFLRPIAEVVTMLFQPILLMVRPIVQLFRTLMMPFRELATQGMAAASQLISQGMQEGGETGAAMVGAGLQGALSSASLLLSGFFEVALNPIAQLLDNVFPGVAAGFEGIMDAWQSAAIEGIFGVMTKADFLFNQIDDYTTLTTQEVKDSFNTIDAYFKDMGDAIGGFKIETWKSDLLTAQDKLQTVFDPMILMLDGEEGTLAASIDTVNEAIKNLGMEVPNLEKAMGDMVTNIVGGFLESGKGTPKEKTSTFEAGLPNLQDKIAGTEATGFWTKVWDVISTPMSVENIMKGPSGVGSHIAEVKDEKDWKTVEEAQQKVFDNYFENMPLMTQKQLDNIINENEWVKKYYDPDKGLISMSKEEFLKNDYKISEEYYNPVTGKVTNSVTSGFKFISDGASTFAENMKAIGVEISNIASQARADAARAKSSANNASSAASKISTIRTGP